MLGYKFVKAAVVLAVTVTASVKAESLRLSELLLNHYLNAPLYQMSNPPTVKSASTRQNRGGRKRPSGGKP